MAVADKIINEVAAPLTGFWVSGDEAKCSFDALMSLRDLDFIDACRRVAHHHWKADSPTNRIKVLLENLGALDRDRLLERIVTTAAASVLPSLPVAGEAPYASYVKKTHMLVREMGLGKRGALGLLDEIIAGTVTEKIGAAIMLPSPATMLRVRRRLHVAYEVRFGTDNVAGWDKVMHFVKGAQLAFNHDATLAVNAGVAKEVYDELERWAGKDPEGWSDADIDADLAGVKWGTWLKSQP